MIIVKRPHNDCASASYDRCIPQSPSERESGILAAVRSRGRYPVVSHDWIDEKQPQLRASSSHLNRAFRAINVALFLPFGCHKRRQTAAKPDTKRRQELARP